MCTVIQQNVRIKPRTWKARVACQQAIFIQVHTALRVEGSREKSLMDQMSARVSIFVKAQHSSPVSDTVLALL